MILWVDEGLAFCSSDSMCYMCSIGTCPGTIEGLLFRISNEPVNRIIWWWEFIPGDGGNRVLTGNYGDSKRTEKLRANGMSRTAVVSRAKFRVWTEWRAYWLDWLFWPTKWPSAIISMGNFLSWPKRWPNPIMMISKGLNLHSNGISRTAVRSRTKLTVF